MGEPGFFIFALTRYSLLHLLKRIPQAFNVRRVPIARHAFLGGVVQFDLTHDFHVLT